MKQLVVLAILLCSHSLWAQKSRFKIYKENSNQRAVITNSKPLSFYYEKVSWNQKPTEIESGFIYLRDRKSGKVTEVILSETKPNSGIFNVDYPIGVLKMNKVEAEIFSAPQSMLKGKDRVGLITDLIRDNSIKRKPFLLRVLRKKGQILDVFDSKENAINAYNKYRKEMGLSPEGLESESIIEVANQQKVEKKKVIDTSTLQSLFMANENDQTATNEKNHELREVLKKLERKRRQSVLSDAKTWSRSKEIKNAKKATDLVKTGVDEIKSNNLPQSREHFLKASDLAPFQEDVYQQYGISLYRDKKYNQAIVVLDISSPSEKRKPEKQFYLGMSYYQLKDYKQAIIHFDNVMKTEDKSFANTAAFYKGASLIELSRYDEAKKAFQYVLDHSDDPKLDARAEKFIEYALDRQALEKKRSNWFFLDGVLGLMYDSNIILADNQLTRNDDVTDENGWRFLAQLNPQFRPYYDESDEIRISLDVTTIKSFDEGFGSNETAETADPLVLGISTPWIHRTTLAGKGYFFELSPGYETIIMDLDGTGMATITNSIKLDFNNTLVVNKNWIAKGDYSFASNDANILGDETGADSFSAALKLSSIFILNKDSERYLIPEFSYRINSAESSTYAFNRMDIAVTFTTGIFNSFMWNSRVSYFLANYESNRTDNNYALSTGITRRISSNWNWGLTGTYTVNDSTTNQYNKYNILTNFSFSY